MLAPIELLMIGMVNKQANKDDNTCNEEKRKYDLFKNCM